jgi:hypothetical protein
MRLELEKEEIAVDTRSLRSKFREGIGSDALLRITWRAREYVYAAYTPSGHKGGIRYGYGAGSRYAKIKTLIV